jgi:hypothetical protein
MADVYSILHGIVDKQIRAGTFVPGEAARKALSSVLALDGLVESEVPHIGVLLFEALCERAKAYLPRLNAANAAAERGVESGQTDFNDLSADFSRLIRSPVAMDEAPGTVRLPPIEMTLPQLRQHCELIRTKATQNLAKIKLYELFIAQHPEWEATPLMKLSQILNLDTTSAA